MKRKETSQIQSATSSLSLNGEVISIMTLVGIFFPYGNDLEVI